MIVTWKCVIKSFELTWIFLNSSPIYPHNLSFHTLSLHFLFDMSYNSLHLRTNSVKFFIHFWTQNLAAPVASKRSKCSAGDVRLFTLSELSRYRQFRTRSVTSNILAQQRWRNGTETWRRRSSQCEHLRLITREKILLNGDVPWRNGYVTYSVNRSLVL